MLILSEVKVTKVSISYPISENLTCLNNLFKEISNKYGETGWKVITNIPANNDNGCGTLVIEVCESEATNSKGDWVHDWAKFRAKDKDGQVYEFMQKPIIVLDDRWINDHKHNWVKVPTVIPKYWEDSLEER